MNEKYEVVYLKSIEKCPVCNSKLSKNGTDRFLLNKSREIKKQKYVCKDKECQEHTRACLDKFIDKNRNYTQDLREFGLNTSLIDYCSYDKKSDLIELTTGYYILDQQYIIMKKLYLMNIWIKKKKK
ncbi:hypothetical protein MBCUT_12240 [Methanobrevibacter cuticularis]|uniref:Uncharacterized protein n=1 Tax=Methanobrevibacter cuticularis TaxID=47311 RepID=A0A166DS74_9EURY|nr:hypothetical protein [Methanobrevibacter cuticularis]KZX15898.1 hypothetical protein MBCUT_12240 [Methanobrevibacter cuticularis]